MAVLRENDICKPVTTMYYYLAMNYMDEYITENTGTC